MKKKKREEKRESMSNRFDWPEVERDGMMAESDWGLILFFKDDELLTMIKCSWKKLGDQKGLKI